MDLEALKELEERWSELSDATVSDSQAMNRLAINGSQILVGEVREECIKIKMPELARTYREEASVSAGQIRMGAFSDLVYARIQDRGGVIRPKTRKALSIPMTAKAKNRWPRDWPHGHLFRPKGKDWLGEAKGSSVVVHYLLRKQVEITGKRYIDAASKRAVPKITKFFLQYLADRIAGKEGDADG
jgi:hypothetical protein